MRDIHWERLSMKQLPDRFLDDRLRWPEGVCIHCGIYLDKMNRSREHTPSKCFLRKPYPDGLMTMEACRECNSGYSRDEEYMSMLLAAVLAGSTDPEKQISSEFKRKFETQPALRERIRRSRLTSYVSGVKRTTHMPEHERVKNVVVKNARCHALYELDRWMDLRPDHIMAMPLESLTHQQYDEFEGLAEGPSLSGWPEIGTRMFMRLCLSLGPGPSDMVGPWIIVQDNSYRFWVEDVGEGVLVRSVIHEYLATEVYWQDRNCV